MKVAVFIQVALQVVIASLLWQLLREMRTQRQVRENAAAETHLFEYAVPLFGTGEMPDELDLWQRVSQKETNGWSVMSIQRIGTSDTFDVLYRFSPANFSIGEP